MTFFTASGAVVAENNTNHNRKGVDAFVFMSILCLLQDRKEKERYRHIDEKNGDNAF